MNHDATTEIVNPPKRKPDAPFPGSPGMNSFAADLRAVLIPARKWHYLFHVLVMLVASSYWIGSVLKMPDASWAEIAMYRPRGDNQVFPAISALSRFNFGDPTDSIHYGKGTAGT